jgi:hypothetical protein
MGWQALPRILGWLLLGLALVAAGADGLRALEGGQVVLSGLSGLWQRLDPGATETLQRVAAALPPAVRGAAGWLAHQPAVPLLGLAGLVLLLLFRPPAPGRRARPGSRLTRLG